MEGLVEEEQCSKRRFWNVVGSREEAKAKWEIQMYKDKFEIEINQQFEWNCLDLNIWFQIYINQIQFVDFRKHKYIHKHYMYIHDYHQYYLTSCICLGVARGSVLGDLGEPIIATPLLEPKVLPRPLIRRFILGLSNVTLGCWGEPPIVNELGKL